MAQVLSAHNERVARTRDLRKKKGRREHNLFAFEGPTLLEEAYRSNVPVNELYVTHEVYDRTPLIREFEAREVPVYLVDDRTFGKISDVETPSGILAVSPLRSAALADIFQRPGPVLTLADLNDPGNAGTLLRSADAFGAAGVIFGDLGVDPYHPKVVRGAMGALFHLPVAIADPCALEAAASAAGATILGLDLVGIPLVEFNPPDRTVLVVGHERRGLDRWGSLCVQRLAIPIRGEAESLNASVAGSIALYALARGRG